MMNQTFLEKWQRLIYTPLDLAPVPYFDVAAFKAWVIETGRIEDDKLKAEQFVLSRERYIEKVDVYYPWEISFLISPRTVHLPNPWVNGFDQRFPQLAAYLGALPMDQMVLSVVWIAQDGAVEYHRDRDGPMGIRINLTPPVGSKLKFRAHPEDPQTYRAIQPQRPHGWAFNNVFFHGVDKVEGTEDRIVVVVQGIKRTGQADALLERSIAKFASHVLWDERALVTT